MKTRYLLLPVKLTSFLIFSFLALSSSMAQKETNIWYFGKQAGLDFSGGTPVAITNSAMNATEGCAVICDKNTGGLLFYTDGITVYNKNHFVMPNGTGLLGNGANSTQSALIVPFPNSASLYYVFTISDFQANQGFRYSVVDMNLNGGLGDVTTKNTMLLANASEKLAGVYADCKDVWVLIHQSGTAAYYAYLVTAAGISAPVITNIGPVFPGNGFPGHLKFSPDGSMVAVTGYVQMSQVHLLDFNKNTGVLSNYRLIDPNIAGYGVSFSPDNTKLYVGYTSASNIYQYNVTLGTAAAIFGSKTFIGNAGAWLCAFELGPDGKLYIAKNALNIDVINAPNQLGAACNYAINAVNLAGKTSVNGLPNYIESYFDTSFIASSVSGSITSAPSGTLCAGSSVTLTASGGTNYSWSNGQTTTSITVTPAVTTIYSVIVNGACPDTAFTTITIGSITAAAGPNSTICAGQNATLTASGGTNYSWNTGATTSSITPTLTSTSTFTVIVSSGTCADTASATVTINTGPILSVSGNTSLCTGDATALTASGGNVYSWSTGATTTSISSTLTSTSTFTVIATDASGCSGTTSITVTVSPPPVANISGTDTICEGDNAFLTANGGGNYLWNTGQTTSVISSTLTSTSTFTVIVSVVSCSDTAFHMVNVLPNPAAGAGMDITIMQGQTATLSAAGGGTYSWNNGAADTLITVSPTITTNYCVIVTAPNNCRDTACVTVYVKVEPMDCSSAEEFFLPNAFSPNGDGENDVLKIYYGDIRCIETFKLVIYNRWGEKVFETANPSQAWDGTFRGKGKPENTAVFVYYLKATLISGKEIIRKENVSLIK